MNRHEMLHHLIGKPTHVAIGLPGKVWVPSPVEHDDIDGLIHQHLAGVIDSRLVVRKVGAEKVLATERNGRCLGAYTIVRDADGAPWASWLCIDADVKGDQHRTGLTQPQADALSLMVVDLMSEGGLEPVRERSHGGHGWHVWSLLSEPLAGPCAEWLAALISTTAAKEFGLPPGVRPESFPKNGNPDTHGSLVALPFTGAPRGPGGGRLVNVDGSERDVATVKIVPRETIRHWRGMWMQDIEARERQALEHRAIVAAKPKRQVHKNDIDLNLATCEQVVESIAPQRITDRDESEIYVDCPRHASSSRKSLHVNRAGGGWHCFACNVGGGPWKLAKWLMPDGSTNREIAEAIKSSIGVRS